VTDHGGDRGSVWALATIVTAVLLLVVLGVLALVALTDPIP
jgi:hypothetical protein